MEDAKEEIRARLPIEDVVGRYVELKKAGRNMKGKSPWGVDRTPSFMVSPEKGIWHDFSANKGGDIFSFLMEVEGLEFREALEKLAGWAGVELKRYAGDAEAGKVRKRAFAANEMACKFFQLALMKNKQIAEYVFYKRNMNRKTVEEFRIGYAPSAGKAMVELLIRKGFSIEEIRAGGLVNQYDGDLFRGRMTIPLMDAMGQVIGFTARIVDDRVKDAPKYLNTPETMLYNKGRHIFGLSQAKEAIRRNGFVVVVEGNMDVISSHQVGVKEAVATGGTAMTEMHLKELARRAKDIRLAYDGDDAGINAAERAIMMAGGLGISLSVVADYYGAKDADELIQKDPKLWQKAVAEAIPAVDWLLGKYEERLNMRTAQGKKMYSDVAARLLKFLRDPVEVEHYEKKVVERLGVSLEAFRSKKDLYKNDEPKNRQEKMEVIDRSTVDVTEVDILENKVLSILIEREDMRGEWVEGDFWGEKHRSVVKNTFIVDKKDEELYNWAEEMRLEFDGRYSSWSEPELHEEIEGLAKELKIAKTKIQKEKLMKQLADAEILGDEKLVEAALVEINNLNKE